MRPLLIALLLGCTGLATPAEDPSTDQDGEVDNGDDDKADVDEGVEDVADRAPPLVTTDPANAPARKYDGPKVDLYLSAGNHEIDAAGEVTRSCNNENSLNCRIYKVTWDLAEQRATTVQTVVDDPAFATIYPVISPNGLYMANTSATIRRGRVRKAMNHTVHVRDLSKWRGGAHPIIHSIEEAKWPGWNDDDTLLITRFSDKHWGDVMSVGRESGTPKRVLGPGATKKGPSFSQARTNPVDSNLVATHGDDVYKGKHGATVPHVNHLGNGKQWGFDMDRDGDGSPDIVGCAHTAWTPDGNGVVCTEQFTDDYPYEGGPDYNHLHLFEKKGDSYAMVNANPTQKGYLFKPKSPEELRSFHPDYFTKDHPNPAGGGYCEGTVYYKNALYCGNDHTVVLTLWCIDTKNYNARRKVINSRAVLVDFEDWNNPKHYDITSSLEAAGMVSGAQSDFVHCYQ